MPKVIAAVKAIRGGGSCSRVQYVHNTNIEPSQMNLAPLMNVVKRQASHGANAR